MKTLEIEIPVKGVILTGNLSIPENVKAVVLFSHGSGSSRFSAGNIKVAKVLYEHRIATLLTDLLSPEEDKIYENRFDIELLTERLVLVTNFIDQMPELNNLPMAGIVPSECSLLRASVSCTNHASSRLDQDPGPSDSN